MTGTRLGLYFYRECNHSTTVAADWQPPCLDCDCNDFTVLCFPTDLSSDFCTRRRSVFHCFRAPLGAHMLGVSNALSGSEGKSHLREEEAKNGAAGGHKNGRVG